MTGFDVRPLVTRVMVTVVLSAALAAPAAAQDLARAQANQLHAAIANGDVEALKYWLDVRHADPNASNASEPGLTPLARCLALAGRVLDGTAVSTSSANGPAVGLRVLQDMVALLDARGAKLTDAERSNASSPVLRWYDDAVGHPPAAQSASAPASTAAATSPAGPPATPPNAAATPSAPASATTQVPPPVIDIARRETLVVVSPDAKRSCNGNGHVIFLVNNALMPITARVSTRTEKAGEAKPQTRTDTYALEQGANWELGCDTLPGGGRVKYELKEWRY
jgi:hypothetical protein